MADIKSAASVISEITHAFPCSDIEKSKLIIDTAKQLYISSNDKNKSNGILIRDIQEKCYPIDPLPHPRNYRWVFFTKELLSCRFISTVLRDNGWECIYTNHNTPGCSRYIPKSEHVLNSNAEMICRGKLKKGGQIHTQINPDILNAAREFAKDNGIYLNTVIECALSKYVSQN